MAFLGLVPAERSTGERVRRAGLTLAGGWLSIAAMTCRQSRPPPDARRSKASMLGVSKSSLLLTLCWRGESGANQSLKWDFWAGNYGSIPRRLWTMSEA